MSEKDLSLLISIVGCIATFAGLLKLLIVNYFKKAKELEDIRSTNNDAFARDLKLHGQQLDRNTASISVLEDGLKKNTSAQTKTQAIVVELQTELKAAREQATRMIKIETDIQKINDTYLFIKTKLNQQKT